MGKKKVKYNYKKEVCEEIFFKILYDDTGYFKKWYKETGGRPDLYIPEFRSRIIMDYLNEQEAWATDPNACASHLKKNKKLLKKALSKTYEKPERLGAVRCDIKIRMFLTPKCLDKVLNRYGDLIVKILGGGQHDI